MKNLYKICIVLLCTLLLIVFVTGLPLIPQGNINLLDRNNITRGFNASFSGNVSAGFFIGDGSGLTNVEANDLTWLSNWSAYNDSWSSTTNDSYFLVENWNSTNLTYANNNVSLTNYINSNNDSVNNYISFNNGSINNWVSDIFIPYVGALKNILFGAHNFSVDSNVLFVDSTNNRVGIGTSSPTATLTINTDGTSTSNRAFVINDSDGNLIMAIDDSGQIFIKERNTVGEPSFPYSTTDFTHSFTGNSLLIGNLDGGFGFDIVSNINRITSVGGTARPFFFADSAGDFMFAPASGETFNILRDLNVTNSILDTFYVNVSNQRVGIGTATPQSTLNINGTLGSLAGGLSFGDGDTGFYESADDTLNIAIGGASNPVAIINSQGILGTVTGEAAVFTNKVATDVLPVLTFRNDLNTGIGRAGADILSLIAGGSEGLRISESANMVNVTLINTTGHLILPMNNDATSPTLAFGDGDTGFYESSDDVLNFAGLQLQGSASGTWRLMNEIGTLTNPIYASKFDTNTGMGTASADTWDIIVNGVNAMHFDTTGVGIGTTTPQRKLHVAGDILANGTINATTDICIEGGACLSGVYTKTESDAINTSNNNWITENNNSVNNHIVEVNTSMKNYADFLNTSNNNYILENNNSVNNHIVEVNTSMKNYVDGVTSATAFDYFFTNEASNITNHFNMTDMESGEAESQINSASLGVGTFSIVNYTTVQGEPEFTGLRQGIYDVHIHLNNSGTKNVKITPRLWNISQDGSKGNLLITFETSEFLTSTSIPYELHGVLSEETFIGGDRLNLELLAVVSGGGSNVVVTVVQEGDTDSHITVETSSSAFNNIFIRQDGSKSLTANWNQGAFNLTNTDSWFLGIIDANTVNGLTGFINALISTNNVSINNNINSQNTSQTNYIASVNTSMKNYADSSFVELSGDKMTGDLNMTSHSNVTVEVRSRFCLNFECTSYITNNGTATIIV